MANPVVPLYFDVLQLIMFVLWLGLAVVAITTIARDSRLGAKERTLWLAFIVVVPFIGSVVRLGVVLAGRSSPKSER